MSQRPVQKEREASVHVSMSAPCLDFNFEDVCKPGNTLLWDLVQDDKAVRLNTYYQEYCMQQLCF